MKSRNLAIGITKVRKFAILMQLATLQRVALEAAYNAELEPVLTAIVQGLCSDPTIGLARLWLIGPGDLCTVDLESDPAIAAASVDRLRIFRGYAGWSPGQLDGELSRGGWFTVDAETTDLWSEQPDGLYERVLRRQQGDLRWFANVPEDPSLN